MKNYELQVCGIHIENYEFNKTSSYFYNEFVLFSIQKFVS